MKGTAREPPPPPLPPAAVVVFNLTRPGNILRALLGDPEIGTLVDGEEEAGGEAAGEPALQQYSAARRM